MKRRLLASVGLAVCLVLCFCLPAISVADVPSEAEISWFKGNTHTHTTISDGDSSPEDVTLWYRDHGYNFLVLTDHNIFDDPEALGLSIYERPDFILVPGGEITGKQLPSNKPIHTTAQNVNYMPDWTFYEGTKTEVIQYQVDGTIAAGGKPILAHPVWLNALHEYDIFPVKDLHMMEIINGHVDAYWNYGTEGYPDQEELWDRLLTMGMVIYGVCTDDEHTLTINFDVNSSGPGYSWVMVQADELTPLAVTEAMDRGDFYSSTGVILETVSTEGGLYIVKVDKEATQKELSYPHIFGSRIHEGPRGYKIEFIGPRGEVLKTVHSDKGVFKMKPRYAYVRCKVTFSRLYGDPKEKTFEEFYAWTQPVFTDGRE